MKKIIFILLVAVSAFSSCKRDNETLNTDFGYEYYPDTIGAYVVYQVDSTKYDDFTRPVTVTKRSLQVKEVLESRFVDNLGRPSVRIARFERDSADQEWQLARYFSSTKTNRTIERSEENLRFIKLVFPPNEGQTWEGNKYIEAVDANKYLADWVYRITASGVAATVNGISYESTVSITLRDRETLIEKALAKEIYAKGVGLVYKEWWNVETQNTDGSIPFENRAERGSIVKMQAIAHGIE